MARTVKRPVLIIPACIAAMGFAAPPAAGAERVAMAGIAAEKPAADRTITLTLDQDMTASQYSFHKGGTALGLFEKRHFSPTAGAKPRDRKALRIDLFRFRVTRPLAGDRSAGSPGTFPPSVVHIGVKQGATPDSKVVGVEMPVAPYVVVGSRLGPGGDSNTGVRFRLLY